MSKTSVLILTDWYVPGYKAGGPITSVYRLVQSLEERVDFRVLTNHHDWHDTIPYDLEHDRWITYEGARVKYLSRPTIRSVIKELRQSDASLFYFNGIYAPLFHALPLLYTLALGSKARLIVAPRGMLNSNAIELKGLKKRILIRFYQLLRMEQKVTFHSTSAGESDSIRYFFPKSRIEEIPNLPAPLKADLHLKDRSGYISVGRVSPVKNTEGLVRRFNEHPGLALSLVGTSDEEEYFAKCKSLSEHSDQIRWYGGKAGHELSKLYADHRFFITMTTGENFGHAIIEALAQGCPVLISDRTPWNDIEEAGAGWVIDLDDSERWDQCIQQSADLSDEAYRQMAQAAQAYVKRKFDLNLLREQYLDLFGAKN